MIELEAKLRRLGIVNLNLSSRGNECVAIARVRGGRTVVSRGATPDRAVERVVTVLSLAAIEGGL